MHSRMSRHTSGLSYRDLTFRQIEKTPNSYGPDFNDNGGGVWATQFDVTGI